MKFEFIGPHKAINVTGFGTFAPGDVLEIEKPKERRLDVERFATDAAYWKPADADAKKAAAGEFSFAEPPAPAAPASDDNTTEETE